MSNELGEGPGLLQATLHALLVKVGLDDALAAYLGATCFCQWAPAAKSSEVLHHLLFWRS